jgi:DNA modification methylase
MDEPPRAGPDRPDVFSGAGTTGVAALELGHRYIGIDINSEYHDLAIPRLNRATATTNFVAPRQRREDS